MEITPVELSSQKGSLKKGLIILAVIVVATLAVYKIKQTLEVDEESIGEKKIPAVGEVKRLYDESNLPKGKCSPVITNFGSALDYVKCDGAWFCTPRQGNVDWKSLADNASATNLLNNKYPSH